MKGRVIILVQIIYDVLSCYHKYILSYGLDNYYAWYNKAPPSFPIWPILLRFEGYICFNVSLSIIVKEYTFETNFMQESCYSQPKYHFLSRFPNATF